MKSEGSLFRGACIPCATAKTGCEHSTRGKDKDKTDAAPPKKKARRGSPKASGSRKRPLVVSSGAEDSDAERASLSGLWSLVGKVSGRTKKIETAVEGLARMDEKLDQLMKIAVRPDIPDSDDLVGWTEWFEEEAKENGSDVAAEATRLIELFTMIRDQHQVPSSGTSESRPVPIEDGTASNMGGSGKGADADGEGEKDEDDMDMGEDD
ncbi:hypothetical protein ONZ45_g8234 [Pleurotus djamor]|nr:hypothetical protein ONZ45_g8234 [Pleurotus djamor]